jgi:hypothetical protein
MEKSNFFRRLIRRSFLEDAKFKEETRTKFNMTNILWFFGFVLSVVIFLIFAFVPAETERAVSDGGAVSIPDYSKPMTGNVSEQERPNLKANGRSSFDSGGGIGYGAGAGGYGDLYNRGGQQSRTRNANQVIKRGQGGNDPGSQFPMGTLIEARLITGARSVNTASPVMALIPQEITTDAGASIPAGTKAIGTASFDEGARRLQLKFSTLVYDDGSQHGIQAIAMMGDGLAGIPGDYNSGQSNRQIGSFIGNFVGGLADGLKERTSGGAFNGTLEPGSIKNGILNGVALSAQDQAKFYSEDLTSTRPSMSAPPGASFYLFLEKEYLP